MNELKKVKNDLKEREKKLSPFLDSFLKHKELQKQESENQSNNSENTEAVEQEPINVNPQEEKTENKPEETLVLNESEENNETATPETQTEDEVEETPLEGKVETEEEKEKLEKLKEELAELLDDMPMDNMEDNKKLYAYLLKESADFPDLIEFAKRQSEKIVKIEELQIKLASGKNIETPTEAPVKEPEISSTPETITTTIQAENTESQFETMNAIPEQPVVETKAEDIARVNENLQRAYSGTTAEETSVSEKNIEEIEKNFKWTTEKSRELKQQEEEMGESIIEIDGKKLSIKIKEVIAIWEAPKRFKWIKSKLGYTGKYIKMELPRWSVFSEGIYKLLEKNDKEKLKEFERKYPDKWVLENKTEAIVYAEKMRLGLLELKKEIEEDIKKREQEEEKERDQQEKYRQKNKNKPEELSLTEQKKADIEKVNLLHDQEKVKIYNDTALRQTGHKLSFISLNFSEGKITSVISEKETSESLFIIDTETNEMVPITNDTEKLKTLIKGDREFIEHFIEDYKSITPAQLTKLTQPIKVEIIDGKYKVVSKGEYKE